MCRARGRSGGRHSKASQYSYVPLGRHLVSVLTVILWIKTESSGSQGLSEMHYIVDWCCTYCIFTELTVAMPLLLGESDDRQERIRPGHWYRSVLCISFSVFDTVWSRDRTNRPLLFRDRISNCTSLFRPEPNRTEPHKQTRVSCRGSFTPQTRDVRILKCCLRISPRILTTDPHPHSPVPTQAPSRSRVSNPSEPGKLDH